MYPICSRKRCIKECLEIEITPVVCCGHPQNIYFLLNGSTRIHCVRKLILRWNSFWSSIFSLKALGKKKIYFENERQRNFQCGWFVELYWQVVWLMDFRISWLVDIYWLIGWFLKFGDWVIFILDLLKSVHFKNKVTRSSFHSKPRI